MADYNVRVVVDPAGAARGVSTAEGHLNRLSGTADRVRNNLLTIFGVSTFGASVVAGVRSLAAFEQEMSTVQAVSDATAVQLAALTETARKLGATTRFSATESAEGLKLLAQAGFTVEQSIDTVDDVLQLAQAGALGLGEAADITGAALNGFRLETSQATRVADVLAKGANIAATDVRQLGEAMKFVAPVAAGVGVSLEETTAAIAALSNAGLQGSLAGTGLRRVLSELESPSLKTKEILTALGVSTEEVRISQVGLTAALQRLTAAGLNTGQALEVFGDRGGPAFEVLSTSLPKVVEMTGALESAGGTAKRIAEVMDNNLNGALLALRSAVQDLVLEFGELGGSSLLTGFVRGATDALRSLTDNLDTVLRGVQAVAVVIGVGLATQAIPLAIRAVNLLIGAFRSLTVAIASTGIGAVAVAIGAAVGILVAFGDQITVTSDGLVTLQDVALGVFDYIAELVGPLAASIQDGFGRAVAFASEALAGINITFDDVLEGGKKFVNTLIGIYVGLFRASKVIFDRLAGVVIDVLGPNLLEQIGGAVSGTIDFVRRGLERVIEFARDGLKLIGVALSDVEQQLPTLALPEIKVPESVSKLGDDVKAAFLSGLSEDFVGDALAALDPQLRDIAARIQARSAERRAGEDATSGGLPPSQGVPGRPATPEDGPANDINDLTPILDKLLAEAGALQQSNAQREITNELLSIESDLRRELTDSETALVSSVLEDVAALQRQVEIYDEIRGPREALLQDVEALNQLFALGRINAEEYAAAMGKISQSAAELDNTIGGGLRAGIQEIANRTQDFGKNIQEYVVSTVDSATDAIAEFATTGKLNIREFVSDAISQLAKLFLQQAVANLFGGIAGGMGGGAGGLFSSIAGGLQGFATGGQFNVGGSGGTDSQLVAFKATPGEEVSVKTPSQQQSAAPVVVPAPAVNVINVRDPSEIPLGIESAEGEQAVMNVIGRNPEGVRQLMNGR